MRKILAIIYQSLYNTYSDRNLLLIMLAAPLALSTIIGLAFGGASSGDVSIENIPVVIVNLDTPAEGGVNNGEIFAQVLVPPTEGTTDDSTTDDSGVVCAAANAEESSGDNNVLYDLTDAVEMTDADAARTAVDAGEYAAAIIIPADFSQRITYSQQHPELEPTSIEVYANSGSPISASVIRSISESLANQIATGNIAIAATIDTLIARATQRFDFGIAFAGAGDSFQPNFACAFTPAFNPLRLEAQTVSGERATFDPLVIFGTANAMFFMLFTAQGVATGVLEEQRTGTLQRLLVSPTSRLTILLGKLGATFINSAVQITLLIVAFTVVGTLMRGEFTLIFGTNFAGLVLMIAVASLSVAGLGVLLVSIARTPEMANTMGSVINITMAVLGGAFFSVSSIPALQPLTALSLVHWGTDAFTKLAQGNPDIGLNIAVMLIQGVLMFLAGFWLFNRRFDI